MEFLLLFWKAFGPLIPDNYLWTRGPATAGHCRRPLQGFPKSPSKPIVGLIHWGIVSKDDTHTMAQSDLNLIYDLWPRRSPPEWTMCRGARLFLFSSSSFPFSFFLFLFLFFSFLSPFPSADNFLVPRCPSCRGEQRDLANKRQPADVGLPVARERANRNFVKSGLESISRGISQFFWSCELKLRTVWKEIRVKGEVRSKGKNVFSNFRLHYIRIYYILRFLGLRSRLIY